ncbi:glycosyltransferase WbuB [Cyclobacteriaceae bacterium YHN15]|nr:glycosyltransferase WbuB [Cyclobacteriaceae bacterium YHN15]
MIDIIHAFREEFEERVLITGFLNPRNHSLDPKVKLELMVPYDRGSGFRRLFTWSMGFLKALWLIKTKYRNADLFLVSNPPFAPLIPLFCSNAYKILIYDIYPDALVEFGYLNKGSFLIKRWEKANRKVFASAQKVYTLTEGMALRVSHYVNIEKIQVVPIWTDNAFLKPIPKGKNPFIKEMGWQGKFIVLYSGNLGKSHPVEILVELAKQCKEPEIHFVIIGGGDKYEMLRQMIQDFDLSNMELLPWQPTEKLPHTLTAADLALVTLSEESAELSIPSKTFNLMSVGVPVLGIAPSDSALAELIKSEKIGQNFDKNKVDEILDFIISMYKNPDLREKLIENILTCSSKFGPENAEIFRDNI